MGCVPGCVQKLLFWSGPMVVQWIFLILTLWAGFFDDFLNALVVVLNTGKITCKTGFGWRKGFMVAEVAEEDFEVRPEVRPEIY